MKSAKLMQAIRYAIDEAELCYQFTPGSYAMSVLNALYAVEQIYLADQREHDTAGEREHEKLARHEC